MRGYEIKKVKEIIMGTDSQVSVNEVTRVLVLGISIVITS